MDKPFYGVSTVTPHGTGLGPGGDLAGLRQVVWPKEEGSRQDIEVLPSPFSRRYRIALPCVLRNRPPHRLSDVSTPFDRTWRFWYTSAVRMSGNVGRMGEPTLFADTGEEVGSVCASTVHVRGVPPVKEA